MGWKPLSKTFPVFVGDGGGRRRRRRIALFDLVNHDGAAPASRYTLSVAFGDEGLRLDDDLANDFAASYAVAASSLLPLFAKP
uniref:Uncharacterized protein n=1 Tax=Oryza barthii TaxID=65489 RepID=A0A0D3H0I6_9ORYZ